MEILLIVKEVFNIYLVIDYKRYGKMKEKRTGSIVFLYISIESQIFPFP